jgi:hypothetical protein
VYSLRRLAGTWRNVERRGTMMKTVEITSPVEQDKILEEVPTHLRLDICFCS